MDRYTYKAKRKDNEKWVYGELLTFNYPNLKTCIKKEDGLINRRFGWCTDDTINTTVDMFEIIPKTLCQCTGLKDIEGNYIFENDILEVPSFIENNQEAICIYNEEHNVNDIIGFGLYTYDDYHQRYSNLVQSDEWDEFKIIGNKFDKE